MSLSLFRRTTSHCNRRAPRLLNQQHGMYAQQVAMNNFDNTFDSPNNLNKLELLPLLNQHYSSHAQHIKVTNFGNKFDAPDNLGAEERVYTVPSDSGIKGCKPDSTLRDVSLKMSLNKVSSLVVVDDMGILRGVITERDVIHSIPHGSTMTGGEVAKDWMTPVDKLVVARETADVTEIMEMMQSMEARHMPLVDRHNIMVRMISIRDVQSIALNKLRESVSNVIF